MKLLCARFIDGCLPPICRAHVWAMERLIEVDGASGDIRWAMLSLALRCSVQRIRQIALRLTSGVTDADSMVAAGGG
jgi:hypothetical protein